MGRIKRDWDIKHPELNYFTAKNPRDHADRIKKKISCPDNRKFNVTSTNTVKGVTCENIRIDEENAPESIKSIADNETRSQEAPRDTIKEQLMLLFNKDLESLKNKPLEYVIIQLE